MIQLDFVSVCQSIRTNCLELRFEWNGDRWTHHILSTGESSSVPRIWSFESGHIETDHSRVPGPVYQQLHLDQDARGNGRGLLVGQAGPHHFSGAFLVSEQEHGTTIDVDVADRCSAPIEALAATYLIEASAAHLAAGEVNSLEWHHPETRVIFEPEAPTTVAAHESGQGSIRFQALARLDPSLQTQRFRYRWIWTHPAAHPIWGRYV